MLSLYSKNLISTWRLAFLLSLARANSICQIPNNPIVNSCGCSRNQASYHFGLSDSCTTNQDTIYNSQKDSQEQTFHNQPALFIAHGAPSIVLENNDYVKHLKELGKSLTKPDAIVLFSAHWESAVQQISSIDQYSTIYDFAGFPKEMYSMKYPAKGDQNLALEIQKLFGNEGIKSNLDRNRGLDHGAWTILKLMFPEADIPVVALSVNPDMSPENLYKTGAALRSLKKRNILIVGSGGTVHNLRKLSWGSPFTDKWAEDFDKWIGTRLTGWETEDLFNYSKKAPYARDAVPETEHFVPLLIAMGAGEDKKKAIQMHQSYQYGSLSYASWEFL